MRESLRGEVGTVPIDENDIFCEVLKIVVYPHEHLMELPCSEFLVYPYRHSLQTMWSQERIVNYAVISLQDWHLSPYI